MRIGLETGIGASLPEIAGLVGEEVLLPVEMEDLSGQGVFSYLFTIAYDPGVLRIGDVSTAETLSEGMSVQVNSTVPGRITVAASSASALEGTGSLIDLEAEFIGGGTSPLRWAEFVFNEHDPAPNPTDGQVVVDGEIVFNEIHSGPSPTVDWVEILVVADHLDLRGYQVRSLAGEGFGFADDPLWEDLRRGTLILVGGNDAPLDDDVDPGDFVISVRNDPFAPGPLLTGGLLDIQSDADAVQILRPAEESAFAVRWGGGEPVSEFQVDLGSDSLSPEANIAFQGGELADVRDATEWAVVDDVPGTPRQGNSPLNQEWLSDLRGGAEVVSDIDIGEIELVLSVISGQVGRTTLVPVR